MDQKKTILIAVSISTAISFLMSVLVVIMFYYLSPSVDKVIVADKETNLVPYSQTDDRIDYACDGIPKTCAEGYNQVCIYVGCKCDDGFKPVGEVDGCIDNSINKDDYTAVDQSTELSEQGYQYAFAGECQQICNQVGH